MTTRISSFLISAVLAYYLTFEVIARPEGGLGSKSNSVSTTNPVAPRPNSANAVALDPNVIQEMQKFKLEILKSKILKEIRMSEPPNVQAPSDVPQDMLQLIDSEDENALEDGDELIFDPMNEDLDCVEANETSCTKFDFELTLENRTVSSIQIKFKKITPNKPLLITVGLCTSIAADGRVCDMLDIVEEGKTESNWTTFKIPEKLATKFQNDNQFCTVEAKGTNFETHGELKPRLVAYTNSATSERKRRSTRTTPEKECTKECCKIDFFISFKEIGWHFVVAPEGFHANMCYGKCSTDHQNAYPSHYHRTMNLALANKTTPLEKKEHAWTPCCSPTNLQPLSMIYKAANDTNANSTHTLVHHEVPDMIAESCGCW